MKNLELNLCVMNLNDGGELILERYDEMDEEYVEIFEEDKWEVSLEEGLKELNDYFSDYGDRSEEDVIEFEKLKSEYVEMIGDKKGKFYLWGIEYDLQLMFIED